MSYFMPLLFAAAGLVALTVSLLDCDWFFSSRNARYVVQLLGRKKARMAYGAMGALLLIAAVCFLKAALSS